MKKRILAVVALLCTVVCLSGCSSNQGVDVSSIEWVTESYEDYFTFQVPIQWDAGDLGMYWDEDETAFPGMLFILDTPSFLWNAGPGTPLENFLESELTSLDSSETLLAQEDMAIDEKRGCHYTLEVSYETETGTDSYNSDYYAFEAGEAIIVMNFSESTNTEVKNHIINSIQINA